MLMTAVVSVSRRSSGGGAIRFVNGWNEGSGDLKRILRDKRHVQVYHFTGERFELRGSGEYELGHDELGSAFNEYSPLHTYGYGIHELPDAVLPRPLQTLKRVLVILFLIACALTAQAQVTFHFNAILTATNEVPPNSDPTVGTGTFLLRGNTLSFFVNVPAVYFTSVSAFIQGPALPGTTGPVIFDLGGPGFQGGNEFGTPPSWMFSSPFTGLLGAGPFTLTEQQVSDLENGLWYVNVTSYGHTNGQVRGQILFQTAGTFQFNSTLTGTNETKPNNSPYIGSGLFTLDGNVLNYGVGMQGNLFCPTSAGIYGPATNGQDGPLMFDLGSYLTSFNPFSITYGGGLFLTAPQVSDLVAGLWYVNFPSTNYPTGEIRGQIILQSQATLASAVVTNNSLQVTVSQVSGLSYILQAETDLVSANWTSLATNTAPFTFTDTGFTNAPQRFYRAVYKP